MNRKKNNEIKNNSSFLQLVASKKLLLVVVLILAGVAYSFFQANTKVEKMKKELNNLQLQANALEREVDVLNNKLKKVNSKEFIREIARKDLGLVKPGETLYIVVDEEDEEVK